MKQVMDFLLSLPAGASADYELLVRQGIDLNGLDEDFVNNMLVVNAALMAKAKSGDVAAVKELRILSGTTIISSIRLSTKTLS